MAFPTSMDSFIAGISENPRHAGPEKSGPCSSGRYKGMTASYYLPFR